MINTTNLPGFFSPLSRTHTKHSAFKSIFSKLGTGSGQCRGLCSLLRKRFSQDNGAEHTGGVIGKECG